MNSRFISHILSIALLACPALLVLAQQRNDEIVRSFVRTRGTKVVTSGKQRKKPTLIGLGCTLFLKNKNGYPARVNTSRQFREGEAVRFMIESNVDGYLYIFHTENDGPPKMLFPNHLSNSGDNRIKAHVPYEAPSRYVNNRPEGLWIGFDEKEATERFYIVVTREPLPEVKTGDGLVAYCRENPEKCPWQPPASVWSGLLAEALVPALVSQSRTSGQTQTRAERIAANRGVKVIRDAPAPSVVKMSNSSGAKMIVAMVALDHK